MMHHRPLSFFSLTSACRLVFAISLMFSPSALADCPQDYASAMDLLDNAQKSALAGNRPNADAFSKDFETAVSRLSTGHCMPELVRLIDHIRAEQEKYGGKPDYTPAPLTD